MEISMVIEALSEKNEIKQKSVFGTTADEHEIRMIVRKSYLEWVKCYSSPIIQEGLTKKCIYREPKMAMLQGLSPRRYGAPIAIVSYYRDWVFGNTEKSHAPPPPMGAGLAQGGTRVLELENRG